MAAECPLTGTLMIEAVDEPLLSPAEADDERSGWEI